MDIQSNGLAKNNNLLINGREIKTPILFLGQPIGGTPNPWDYFHVDGVLFNAYHIIQKTSFYNNLKKSESIRDFLKIKKRTAIMMDSGGYLFQKSDVLSFDCLEIINLYKYTKPDLGVILDHPYSPIANEEENYGNRWKKTIENTKKMLSIKNDVVIFPVVHGYSEKQISKNWNEIQAILSETNVFLNERLIIGIGSLVPLMMTSTGVVNGKKLIVDLIIKLRKLAPKAHIHAFGIGGATTALIMFYLGVDSLDSVSWRLKAAKGAIQLPGVSDRFISPPKRRKKLSLSDESKLEKCRCPICNTKTLKERKFLLGPLSSKNFENRALHNAWVYQKEIEECRKAIKQKRFEKFIHERLENSNMKSMFRYAVDKLTSTKINDYR